MPEVPEVPEVPEEIEDIELPPEAQAAVDLSAAFNDKLMELVFDTCDRIKVVDPKDPGASISLMWTDLICEAVALCKEYEPAVWKEELVCTLEYAIKVADKD